MSRALVVDDSRAMRAILSKALVESGFEVVQAANGREALETMDREGSHHQPGAARLEHAGDLRNRSAGKTPVAERIQRRSSGDGDHGNRDRTDGSRTRGGRGRICHEALHARGAGGQTASDRNAAMSSNTWTALRGTRTAQGQDPRPGGGRFRGHPAPGHARAPRRTGHRGGGRRAERRRRPGAHPGGAARRRDAGYRDACDGRTHRAPADSQAASTAAHHHVQYADHAGRFLHFRSSRPGRRRLRCQGL